MMNPVQISFIVSGIIFLIIGIVLLMRNGTSISNTNSLDPDGRIINVRVIEQPQLPNFPLVDNDPYPRKCDSDNYIRGRTFENYVIERFLEKGTRWFKILNQRSDKRLPNGEPLPDNSNPDLEIEAFWWATRKEIIAVECKFRLRWINDSIEWCKDHNLENYRKFSDERKMPVFVVLGIGEDPSSPVEIFCFKITPNTSTSVTKHDMYNLKQPPDKYKGFYYAFREHELQYKGSVV